jgi:BASS family bile acid:Na+ symporter
MRTKDIGLIIMAFTGMACGVLFPNIGGAINPYIIFGMMTILFLAFLTLDFNVLIQIKKEHVWEAGFWTLLKLIIMPLVLWGLTMIIAPHYALPVLLLSGTSVGVTSPFFAAMLGARTTPVLHALVLSSLTVPLTMPALVEILYGTQMELSFFQMARMLCMVIFVPLLAAFLVKRFSPKLAKALGAVQYYISICLFFTINMGVFAPYADFLINQQDRLLELTLLALVMGPIFGGAPILMAKIFPERLDGLSGAVGFTYINNVLTVVFSSQFFGPDSTLLAALYMLPLYLMLMPLRWYSQRRACQAT